MQHLIRYMDGLPGLGFLKDEQGPYVYVNQAFVQAFNVKADAVVGRTDADILPAVLAASCGASDAAALKGAAAYQGIETFDVDGRETHYLVTKFILPADEARLLAGLAFDVTMQKEFERRLTRDVVKARAESSSKSAYVAQMSHEFRTPLSAILGFTDLLDNDELTPAERRAYLNIIRRNSRELANLVDDSLDLAKVEANRLELHASRVVIEELLADVSTSLGQMAKVKHLTLSLTRAADAPVSVITDASRLRQILLNIVGNAVKFTDSGSVEALVSGDDHELRINVTDTGRGIAAASRDSLFKPFARVTATVPGTGLGLTLSRQLARALGGDIDLLASEVDQGSTFQIRIRPIAATAVKPNPSVIARAADALSPAVLAGATVLIIDDSKEGLLLVRRTLESAGASVQVASDGAQGIIAAAETGPDVVLMDMQMPVMSGYEATRAMRRRGFDRPILAITARAMADERRRCLDAGCDEHLSKPFTRADLVALVRRYHRLDTPATRTPEGHRGDPCS